MTVSEWKRSAEARLAASGDLDAKTDSSLFLCAALNIEPAQLHFRMDQALDEFMLQSLESMLSRREKGEPEQYIEGAAYFMGLKFKADGRALIPRFDTETLCEAAIEAVNRLPQASVLDMCTGSGCIAVSVAKYCPNAAVTACDISDEALELAAENAALNGVHIELLQSDGFKGLSSRCFDAVLCNPPYLTGEDMASLQKEVTYEPRLALYGGEDGLDFYRRFSSEMRPCLSESAFVIFEVGRGQAQDIQGIFSEAWPASRIDTIMDLNGVERAVRMRL